MPLTEEGYIPEDTDALFDDAATALVAENGNANPRAESTYTFALLTAFAETLSKNQEVSLEELYNAAYVVTASDEALTRKCRNLGVLRREPKKATGVVTFSRDSAATTDYTIPEGTIVETLESNPTQFETTDVVTLQSGDTTVTATIRALVGGTDGNVGANAIQSMPSPPTGIEQVTNNNATGDPTLTDTNGNPLREGKDRESDNALRKRTLDTDAVSEGPSENGIQKAIADVSGVISVNVTSNQENATVNGIGPYRTEVVVFGGNTVAIAETLVETMSATTVLRLQGGVNGTKETADVFSTLLDQTITVPITRPSKTDIQLTVSVIHNNNYVGDAVVKDAIVDYIGGTFSDSTTTTGITIGENVLLNRVENGVEDVRGVEFANVTFADTNNDGNDDRTTDGDGVPVLDISDTNVARIDATNITVNTTAR